MKTILLFFIKLGCFFVLIIQNAKANQVAYSFAGIENKKELSRDSIPSPWNEINLTGIYMKPTLAARVGVRKFPWLPLSGGIVAGGVSACILTKRDSTNPPECDFTTELVTGPSHCGAANGYAEITATPSGIYAYQWSNGGNTNQQSLAAGEYSVTISSPDGFCTDTIFAIVNEVPALEIALENIVAPSSPTTDDGLITINIALASTEVYTVFLDGVLIGTTTGTIITIEGVGEGEHSVQLMADNGCLSNILSVVVPVEKFQLQIGQLFVLTPFSSNKASNKMEMPLFFDQKYRLRSGFSLSAFYVFAGGHQYSRLSFIQDDGTHSFPPLMRLEQMSRILKVNKKVGELSINVGLSAEVFPKDMVFHSFWQLNARMHKSVGKYLHVELSTSLRGRQQIGWPIIDLSLFMRKPFCKSLIIKFHFITNYPY